MDEGAWIFLSHSHKDFDKVIAVRNYLESQRHHPLMFFLRCLNDDDEIDGLIRREIQARSWFVLCDSDNSKASRWVQSEVTIIRGLQEKTYTEIDLEDPLLDLESSLFSLARRASVFLSYAQVDVAIARQIQATLKLHDFGVFSDLEENNREPVQERLLREIENAAMRGAVVLIVSAASLRSLWQRWEFDAASQLAASHRYRVHIVLILLEEVSMLRQRFAIDPDGLSTLHILDWSRGELEENCAHLMTLLRRFDWRAEG
jgi:hypothetical protein